MSFDYFSKNGQILPIGDAVIPISNIAYSYGFGVYESLRVNNNTAGFLSLHIDRLLRSAKILGLKHTFTKTTIERFVDELVAKTQAKAYNIKVLLIGGTTATDAEIFMICSNPKFPEKKWYKDGITTVTAKGERPFPHAKSLNMLQSYIAYTSAMKVGAYDALLINKDGHIVEGTRSNFFAIKGKTITSAPEENVLLGVTRKHVLEIALQNGYMLETANITPDALYEYDGAFLTSTSSKILPIKKVDDLVFPTISEEIYRLIKLFKEIFEEDNV